MPPIAREGDQVPLRGYPLFVGLHVGNEGLFLQCRTTNVKNEQDYSLLDLLESMPSRQGCN
jgi:hypothetical protein